MSYRDDLDAAQARADALQRRVDELEAGQAKLAPAPAAVEIQVGNVPWFAALFFVLLGLGLLAFMLWLSLGDIELYFYVVGGGMVLLGVASVVMASRTVIARPDEALIVSGGTGGTRIVGPGGRRVLIPFVEQAHRLDLRAIDVAARVASAYTRGGTPLDVNVAAVVRIRRTQDAMLAASERFLGRASAEIAVVAGQCLEGAARGLVAELTPEELRKDPDKMNRALIESASPDLERLGLEIETLTANAVG